MHLKAQDQSRASSEILYNTSIYDFFLKEETSSGFSGGIKILQLGNKKALTLFFSPTVAVDGESFQSRTTNQIF